jgi:ABC-type bacteriocin/lantibiotic exporter with double-glycine peptidase domain
MSRNLLAYLLALAGLTGGPGAAQGPNTNAPAVCGPRCVEFLLHWYGKPTDVSDLIDELQQGRPYQMVSLQAMADTLAKRGVHTKAVKLGWGATLDWPHPVVRHSVRPDGGGHFTVLVPPRGEFPRLAWTGDAGYKRALTDEEDGEASGVCLLTAPEPIDDVQPRVRRGVLPVVAGVGGLALMGCGCYGLAVRGRRRQAATAANHPQETHDA